MTTGNIVYDGMGNLIARYGRGTSGKRLMMVTHAMNAAAATMPDPYAGAIVDGAEYGLPGKAVKARGICEQKAGMAALLMALRTIIDVGFDLEGEIIFTTLTSGETGKHDAITSVVEGEGMTADFALIDGDGLRRTSIGQIRPALQPQSGTSPNRFRPRPAPAREMAGSRRLAATFHRGVGLGRRPRKALPFWLAIWPPQHQRCSGFVDVG